MGMQGFGLSRRRLLVSAGSGVLGISVLGTIAGCSAADDPGPAGNATSAPPGNAGSAPAGQSAGAADAGDWRRVDLSFVSAYLLVRGREVAVVDLGTPGSEGAIEAALKAAGTGWDAVRHVVLTHKHQDHAGGLAGVQPLVSASWYAGQADVAAIDSATALKPVRDGDEVFGLQIIGTPGHTAGHICVFEPTTGVLVTGDALRTNAGLAAPDPQFTDDVTQAAASVRKLAALDVRTILPGHGDPMTTGAAEALQKLAASLPAG
jgi:glyoxylase-like metal-dependent hydrolase (beta-lactamase superfamily II)